MQHEAIFSECLEAVSNEEGSIVIAKHRGAFSQDFVYELASEIEVRLLESGEVKSVVKKIFSILIEGLQNIRIHGLSSKELGNLSFFILSKNSKEYTFFFSNLVDEKGKHYIQKSIADINKKTTEELKAHYLEQLSNGVMSAKGGGGLGFITLRMKSDMPLDFNIIPIEDDLHLFTLRMIVNHVR